MAQTTPTNPIYRLLGLLYGLIFRLDQRYLLELSLSFWLATAGWLLLGWGWLRGWPPGILGMLLALLVGGHFLWWWARRQQYTLFVPGPPAASRPATRLPYNRRVPVWVNGRFSLADQEEFVWQRPAEYWQVPLGEHTLMVTVRPGRYRYQFFTAATLHRVEAGWVFAGSGARPALAITFHLSWGPQAGQPALSQFQFDPATEAPPGPLRTIYLFFDTAAARQQLWQHLTADLSAGNRREA
jgi:hypothetical protein